MTTTIDAPTVTCAHCGADVSAQGFLCCPQPKTDAATEPALIISGRAQAQLDAHMNGITADQAAVIIDNGDVIEPVSRVAPIGVPRSRKIARRQAQTEVRAAVKHFRAERLRRAREQVAGLPDNLRDRNYHPADVAEARAVLPKDAGLIDVLTEAARVADLRERLIIVDDHDSEHATSAPAPTA